MGKVVVCNFLQNKIIYYINWNNHRYLTYKHYNFPEPSIFLNNYYRVFSLIFAVPTFSAWRRPSAKSLSMYHVAIDKGGGHGPLHSLLGSTPIFESTRFLLAQCLYLPEPHGLSYVSLGHSDWGGWPAADFPLQL